MNISIFGSGYVGLVSGACLAQVGHTVICVDVDEKKIALLKNGVVPIYEPGLDDLIAINVTAGRLSFTTDASAAIAGADVHFIAVGTPPDEDGSADLKYVLAVAKTIGQNITKDVVVVNKSTVPVGTAEKVRKVIETEIANRGLAITAEVVSNPEFLKEGAAIDDFLYPDRVVVGVSTDRGRATMEAIYKPFIDAGFPLVVMDVSSAELTKYASNAMLATRISFMNDLANFAECVGADIERVKEGMAKDKRIGQYFLNAGCGYGGSCFPKDVKALIHMARQAGMSLRLLEAVEDVNDAQKHVLFSKIAQYFRTDKLHGKIFAIWGLAFKPETDDMREAPSRTLISDLHRSGASVRAYDPVAIEEAARIFGKRDDLILVKDKWVALDGADALVVVTEWKEFKDVHFGELAKKLGDKPLFDGRNIYNPAKAKEIGILYYGIGRGVVGEVL